MNDQEMDRLLDAWQAPEPAPSLRDGLSARFPRAERIGFVRPLKWALAALVVCIALTAALTVGEAQSSDGPSDFAVVRVLYRAYEHLMWIRDTHRAPGVIAKIRDSDPKVYINGLPAAPLQYGPAATLDVEVPGDGVYSVALYRVGERRMENGRLTGWVEAGGIRGNAIEFTAGSSQVRIECNQPIMDSDRPVFVIRRQ